MQQKPGRWDMPPGVTMVKELGELRLPGGDRDSDARDHGYFVGSDGNMWAWYVPPGGTGVWPPRRSWLNEGRPPGAEIGEPMGALLAGGSKPFVFVSASDGCLWARCRDGPAPLWVNLGRPGIASPARRMGTALAGEQPLVFLRASDDNLWLCRRTADGWRWDFPGRAPGGATAEQTLGLTLADGERPNIFVKGSDGNVWSCRWDGRAWRWQGHGLPAPEAFVTAGGGARFQSAGGVEGLDLFVYTTAGLWKLSWRGDPERWEWIRMG